MTRRTLPALVPRLRCGRHVPTGRRLGCFALAALLATACTSAAHRQGPPPPSPAARSATAATPDPLAEVRIGAVFDLSEDAELSQRESMRGAALALEFLNVSGLLLPDGTRRQIRMLVYDDGGNLDRTSLAVANLVDERSLAIIGAGSRESVGLTTQLVEQARLPLITLVNPDVASLPRAPRWTFSLGMDPRDALSVLLRYLSGRPGERLGWIAPKTAGGEAARVAFSREVSARGLTVVAEESYSLDDSALAESLTRLASAGVDQVVVWPRDGAEGARVARAAETRVGRSRLNFGPLAASDLFLLLAGDSAEGARVVVPRLPVADDLWDHDPLTPPTRDFIRAFRLRHGEQPTPAAGAGWDAIRLLAQAIEQSGPDRAAIRDALESTESFYGVNGAMRFDSSRHAGLDAGAFVVARVIPAGFRLPP